MNRFGVFVVIFMICANIASALPPDNLLKEVEAYRSKVKVSPKKTDLLFEYAMSCAYTDNVDEGLDALKAIDDVDPEYGKRTTPILKLKVANDPNNWRLRFRYAFAIYSLTVDSKKKGISREMKRKHKEEAFNQFKEVVRILGDKSYISAWAYGYMGAIRGDQKRFHEGVKLLEKAVKIEPDAEYLHIALGFGYYKRGNILGVMSEALKVGSIKARKKGVSEDEEDMGMY